jgi:hypothetical protein
MIYHDERFASVDPRLVGIVKAIMLDLVVVCGARDKAAQDLAVLEGRSKETFPNSKHNVNPPVRDFAEAVDLCPYPVNFDLREAFLVLGGAMLQEAKKQGIPIRWGGDWNGDLTQLKNVKNNWDVGHFEVVD